MNGTGIPKYGFLLKKVYNILVVGTFEHSIELEQALAELEHRGILRELIKVVPMDTHQDSSGQYVSKSNDFASKGIELGMAVATACSVVGTSTGFILPWGPIIGGLSASVIGFAIGYFIFYLFNRNTHRHLPKKLPEITVIVQCPEDQSRLVKETFWQYRPLTVGQI